MSDRNSVGKEANGAWLKVGLYRASVLDKLDPLVEWAWFRLQFACALDDNKGRIHTRDVPAALARKVTAKKADQLLTTLQEYDLVVLEDAHWSFPRFTEENPPADTWHDPVKRERWARDKRLKRDGELCRRIKERDRNLCRYCGIRVNWNDKISDVGGSYDHVDPDGDNSFLNVVVACRGCNCSERGKRDRTPEQWIADEPLTGRTLKKPGTTAERADAIDSTRGEEQG